MKKNALTFDQFETVSESKLRNKLVKKAGSRDIHGNDTGISFNQKSAYDDLEDKSEIDLLYQVLSNMDNSTLKTFTRSLSKFTSIDDIKNVMKRYIVAHDGDDEKIKFRLEAKKGGLSDSDISLIGDIGLF
tara:strand:- start:1430 stop:1822 length:393 start_codon:yes stop_codon:yes gene_type:complete